MPRGGFFNRQDFVFFFMVWLYLPCCLFHSCWWVGSQFNLFICQDISPMLSVHQQIGGITFTSPTAVPGIPSLSTELISPSRAFRILDVLHEEHFTAVWEGNSANYLNTSGWKLSSVLTNVLLLCGINKCLYNSLWLVQWCEKSQLNYRCILLLLLYLCRLSYTCILMVLFKLRPL